MSNKPIKSQPLVQFRDGSRITTAPPCFERMPCGCIADGKGTITDPIRVKLCPIHQDAGDRELKRIEEQRQWLREHSSK